MRRPLAPGIAPFITGVATAPGSPGHPPPMSRHPHAAAARRLHFTLLESARTADVSGASRRFAVGALVMSVPLVTAVMAARVDARDAATRERPRFLQPLITRPSARAPRTDVVHDLVLGEAPPRPSVAAHDATPRAEVLRPDRGRPAPDSAHTTVVAAAEDSPPVLAFSDIEVDTAAVADPASGGPEYPPALLARGVEGAVLATFVVDAAGRVDERTFLAIESSDSLFTRAVREALPRMKFTPAKRGATPVAQQVEQRFAFRVRRAS